LHDDEGRSKAEFSNHNLSILRRISEEWNKNRIY